MRTYTDFPLGLNLALCTACTNDMHYTETKKSHVSIYTNLSCFQYHTTCLLLKVTAPPCVKTVNWLQVCYCVCACVCVCAHCKASWVPAERQTHRGGALPLYIPKTSGMQALLIVFSPSLSVCVCVCVCCAVWKSQTQSFTAAARAERLWRMTERRLIPLTFTSLLHLLITRQFYSHFTWKVRPPLRYIDLQLRDGQLVVMLLLPTHKFFSHW